MSDAQTGARDDCGDPVCRYLGGHDGSEHWPTVRLQNGRPTLEWLEGAAAISLCPRCEGQEYDVGACGVCENTGLIDGNGNSYRQAPGFEMKPAEFLRRYKP